MKIGEWLFNTWNPRKIRSFQDFLYNLIIVPILILLFGPWIIGAWFINYFERAGSLDLGWGAALFVFTELYLVYFWYFKDFEELN